MKPNFGLEEVISLLENANPDEPIRENFVKMTRQENISLAQAILNIIKPNEAESLELRVKYPGLYFTEEQLNNVAKVIAENKDYIDHIYFSGAFDTEESKEGMRAFQEKRAPDFHKYVK